MKKYNVAIVGASGLVGRTMIKVLEEKKFPIAKLKLLASKHSAGSEIEYLGKKITVEELTEDSFHDCDIALFSAGGKVSKKFAPIAAQSSCIAIDNSSAWRMDPNTPLVVPEVNPEALKKHKGIIANPNCSTIQMLVALKPLSDTYGLKRVVCSTYQSISGAGQKGVDKLMNEIKTGNSEDTHPIAFNNMFHDAEGDDGFSQEENKMINETRKILDLPDLRLAMTCVRLPLLGGHGESLNIELNKSFELSALKKLLSEAEGMQVIDDLANEKYPTTLGSEGHDDVFVGRIRRDSSVENGLYVWITADNLRKGAASNAVQIAEKMIEMKLI